MECEGSWDTLKVPVAMTMESVECYFGDGLGIPSLLAGFSATGPCL